MKKNAFLLLIGASLMLQLKAHVDLINPSGGETYYSGETVNVEWQEVISHSTLNWDLLFSGDGGSTWDTLQVDIPLEIHSYQWVVPTTPTIQGQIKIVQDNVDTDYEGISQNFIISSISGIIEPLKSNIISVYPNPLTDFTTLEFENLTRESHTLTLYDTQGQLVRTISNITSDKLIIRRKNLTSGLYILQLRNDKEVRANGKLAIN